MQVLKISGVLSISDTQSQKCTGKYLTTDTLGGVERALTCRV